MVMIPWNYRYVSSLVTLVHSQVTTPIPKQNNINQPPSLGDLFFIWVGLGVRSLSFSYAPLSLPMMKKKKMMNMKMKATVKGKCGTDKKNNVATSVTLNAGDVRLRASMADATFVNGPSLSGLALTVEKPGSFSVDYDVHRKDFRFQFVNSIKVLDRPLNLTYIHSLGDNRTTLDGALVFDSANKVSANYMFGSGNCKLKYAYVHEGLRTFEQGYDVSKNSWDFAVSQRVYGDDLVKASYQTSSRVLGLEWTRDWKINGVFKIAASVDLAGEVKKPKITAESTWSFET